MRDKEGEEDGEDKWDEWVGEGWMEHESTDWEKVRLEKVLKMQ